MQSSSAKRGHAPGTAAIALIAGELDLQRAARVLNVLLEPQLDVEQVAVCPRGKAYATPLNLDERRVVIFCWTDDFNAGDPAVAALSGRADNLGIGLGVQLDEGTASTGMTTYDLSGWRSEKAIYSRLLGDRLVLADVVAAVRAKMAGKDPPTPSVVSHLVRRRLIFLLVALGAVGSVASAPESLWNLIPKPRVNERRAWSEIKQGDCLAVQSFLRSFPDGTHAQEARDIFAAKELVGVTLRVSVSRQTRWSTSLDTSALHPDRIEAVAALESPLSEAASDACRAMAAATSARLMSVGAPEAKADCHRFEGGWTCAASGSVDCRLQEQHTGTPREVCRLPARR